VFANKCHIPFNTNTYYYYVIRLVCRTVASTEIGGSINNSCHFSAVDKSSNQARLYVCNNDQTIKIFSLPRFEHVAYIQTGVAVNYCSTNSTGSLLACVGDDSFVQIFETASLSSASNNNNNNNNNNTTKPLIKLKEYSDGGFACSFNHDDTLLCAASQDGTAAIWDTRNLGKVLCKFKSVQKGQQRGAIRCVKFAQAPCMDLLCFAEHINVIHLVDCRTMEQQIINVNDTTIATGISEQHLQQSLTTSITNIAGVAFSHNCKNLYVGLENELVSYEINTYARRTFPIGNMA